MQALRLRWGVRLDFWGEGGGMVDREDMLLGWLCEIPYMLRM